MSAAVSRVRNVGQPEATHAVAVAIVPLAKAIRKPSSLPTAEADIPGFYNHFRFREIRFVHNSLQQRVVRIKRVVLIAGQRCGQIESETVNLHLVCPVAQGVDDELDNVRV